MNAVTARPSSTAGMSMAETPVRMPMVPEAVQRIEKELAALGNVIDGLAGRAMPAMRQEPADARENVKEENTSVPLANDLNTLARTVANLRGRLEDIVGALEL